MMRRLVLGLHIEGCAAASAARQVAQLVPCLQHFNTVAPHACQGWTYGCNDDVTHKGSLPTHSSDTTTSSNSSGNSPGLSNVQQQQHATSYVPIGLPCSTTSSALSEAERSTGRLFFTSSSSSACTQQRALHTSSTGLHQQQEQRPLQLLRNPSLPLLQQQHQQQYQQEQQGAHQLQQQRGVKQLRPYAEAPKPPPRFWRPDKDGRMNRMVVRIPPQVQVAVQDGHLVVTGKVGSTSLKLSTLDPSGLVAWRCLSQSAAAAAAGPGTGSLLLMVSPSKRYWRSINTHIDNAVHGVMQGYLVGLTVQGVGYRLEPVSEDVVKAAIRSRRGDAAAEDSSVKRPMFWEQEAEKTNIAYPHKQPAKAIRLKVGYTKAAIFPLPEGVLGFCVKPTLMYLYGVDKQLVTNTAAAVRAVRKPNAYTGNGIQLVGENIRLKQRAGSK